MSRYLLLSLVLMMLLLIPACGGASEPPPTATAESSASVVEVFSWWTGGGEAAGLEAMIRVFNEKHPDITFINATVAGGAGTNARPVLAARLERDDIPDSWQGHAGQELIGTYVAANRLESLNALYSQNGWLEVMPETLFPFISQNDKIYSVPVNIHRANVLWYHPGVLEAHEIEVPESMADWVAAMDRLKEAGMEAPLALGEQWTAMHLMETVLLSILGAEAYNGLWTGKTDWNSSEVRQALELYDRLLNYTNQDASTLGWQDAAQRVINGDAAFHVMGDWAEGFFKEKGVVPHEGFGWALVPGTVGIFQFLSDSFVLPVGAPHRDAAIAWLTVVGSKEGQDAFNPVKGSIPARTDADPSLYDEYLQSAMNDWRSNTIVGSLTHGVVANDTWKSEIDSALGLFLTERDVTTLQAALVAACQSSGPCQ